MSCSLNSTRDWLKTEGYISNDNKVVKSLEPAISFILKRAKNKYATTLPESVEYNDVLFKTKAGNVGFFKPFFEWVDKENTKKTAAISEARDQNMEDARRAGIEYSDDHLFQIDGTQGSRASEETLDKVKQLAKKMGISFTDLADYLKGNPGVNSRGVNALADLTQGIIAISQGKEGIALTEEMVHIATAILEQTNPGLVKEMITQIGKFKIYKDTLNTYKDNPAYQLKNGKPNIRKIKKEAVDKLITELIILENEGSTEFPELLEEVNRSTWRKLWQKVLDFFNIAYKKANVDIFSEAVDQIIEGEIGTVEDIVVDPGEEIFYQISDAQKAIQQKILDTKNYVEKREADPDEIDVDPAFLDTEKVNNWYEFKNQDGSFTKITKRVTDRVKAWYRQKFGDKAFTDKQKAMNEFKRDEGTRFHRFFEEIHARYFNIDGTRKNNIEPRPVMNNKQDRLIYNKLEKYFVELIDSYSQEGKSPIVLSEAIIFDPKEKEAGTVDLIIIEPDGKTHVYDWKFMSVAAGARDVAWFKQGAYNIQLKTYKNILQNYYGVEQLGKNRAIPILLDIRNVKKGVGLNRQVVPMVNDISIGSVNPAEIESLKLLPVSEETESTEIPEIDKLLKKLNAVHSRISSVKVTNDQEKEFKKQRLNIIKDAIRIIQGTLNVEPLVDVISIMKREGENILSDFETLYKHGDIDQFSDKELSEFAETLQDYMAIGEAFGTIGDDITRLFYEKGSEKLAVTKQEKEAILYKKELAEKIQAESTDIRLNTETIKEVAGEFADKYIGRRNLVTGLLGIAKEIKSIGSWFRGVSDLGLAATDVLFKVVTNSKAKASRDSFERVQKLMDIRKRIMDKGGNVRDRLNKIYQKDKKGKRLNKLIYKYDRRFYETIDNLAQDPDRSRKALKTYIDVEGYMKEAKKMLSKRVTHIRKSYTDDKLIQRLIAEEIAKYDINSASFNGYNNYIIKKHPKEAWISEEYKELQKDKDLFELYNFISETNQKANEIGYIENKVKNTFLPFIRKGFAESLAWDFSLKAVKRLTDDLTIRPDDVGYGAVDELTKELVNTIPKYYTHDFTRQEDGTVDMSDVSEDLFKNLSLYVTHLERYKYLSDVEGQLTLVKKIESFKNSYKSSIIGNIVPDAKGEPLTQASNEVNTKLYTNFLNHMLYGQKYPIAANDLPLNTGKVVEFGKNLISLVTGKKFEKNENPSVTSMMKTIDAGNRYFQLKTLGFSILSGAANLFGTTIQMNTQSGVYFKAREFGRNAMNLIGNRFVNNNEREMFVQLVNTFMPLKDDPNYEKIKEAGMTSLTQASFSDMLMVFMRQPEYHVEKSIFLTLLQNSMVDENGRIVNIREYVKAKYPNRYKSSSEYRATKRKIENEITKLKNTKSIAKTKKLVDGKLEIPGLDLNNQDELQRLTNLTRRLSRNATGALADSDVNQISMNLFGKSAMVFKGWIPKLVDTRFGEFRKITDDFSVEVNEDGLTTGEKYDIGRVRLLGYVLGTSIRDKASNIINILSFNEKGIIAIDKMYEEFAQTYMKRTGKKLEFNPDTGEYTNFISKDDFIDLIRTNLRNQLKELAILLILYGITVAMPPPDDDMDRAEKNFYRFTQKVVDRFVSELSFFYNPAEFQKLLGQSAFPVLGIATDLTRFIKHSTMELTGLDISNPDLTKEEVFKKAQPIKYGAKMIPFAKELLNYGAMIDEEFAKEFDIYITDRNR
jgi:hypothetical protein